MPYSIDRYNGTTLTVVEDGTIDTTLDIKLIGKNYAGYGEVQNENLVHLLENFSGSSAPPRPISGQIWFDSGTKKLKFYDGNFPSGKWRIIGGAEIGTTEPVGLTTGDFWFKTDTEQLYTYNGSSFVLIGPESAPGKGTTLLRSRTVVDAPGGGTHAIIEAIVDDDTIYIISADEFTLDAAINPITGFSTIKKGLTLVNTPSTGITTSDHYYWGSASNSLKLGGYTAADFINVANPVFSNRARFLDQGYYLGDGNDLEVFIDTDGTTPIIKNRISSKIQFQTTSSGTKTPLVLEANDILPGSDGLSNIGSSAKKFSTVYAASFDGVATKSATLLYDGQYRSAVANANTANSIVARDANGDIKGREFIGNAQTATSATTATTATQADSLKVGLTYRTASTSALANSIAARTDTTEPTYGGGALKATYFVGTATAARYADLAEKYLTDQDYPVGTVVVVGGDAEVTAGSWGQRAIGVVSKNPAFMMNTELEGGTYIALKGRVPVRVIGSVRKGDRLIAGNNGCATAAVPHANDVFAIALESNSDSGEKIIEAVVL